MKKTTLLILLLTAFNVGFAQYNQPNTDHKCVYRPEPGQMSFYRYERPAWYDNYDVTFYFLDISMENNTTYVGGTVTIDATVKQGPLQEFNFELLEDLSVDSVTVNDASAAFTRDGDVVSAQLAEAMFPGDLLDVRIYYHGQPPSGGFFSGISTDYSNTWQKNVTWTLSEPFNAKQWWPCKQDLYDKADSAWIFITTSDENRAGSNGLLTAVTPVAGNKLRYEWKTRYPIDYYLISSSVADYQEYNVYAKPAGLTNDSILVQNFIYDSPGCLQAYQEGIDRTPTFIEAYSDLYGMYPFKNEKYGHCLAGIGGGMEHQTMTTIGGFSFNLVSHELGHMWFGDNVTCATWSDIWINEGFASYSEYLMHQVLEGQSSADNWMASIHSSVKSQPDGSVYVPPEEANPNNVWRIFDGRLSYDKGAAIIHMIRFELQDDSLFFETLQQFQQQYGDSVATGLDFMGVLNDVSGMDFQDFFDQWYFGEGYPIFDVVWNQNADTYFMTTTETTSYPDVTPFFKTHVDYTLHFTDGSEHTVRVLQDEPVENYEIPIDKEVASVEIDPAHWLVKEVDNIMVGISDPGNASQFSIAPNPASGHVTIFFENDPGHEKQVILTDLSGKILLQTNASGKQTRIDVSGLASGVYLIAVQDGQQRMVQRLIKK